MGSLKIQDVVAQSVGWGLQVCLESTDGVNNMLGLLNIAGGIQDGDTHYNR